MAPIGPLRGAPTAIRGGARRAHARPHFVTANLDLSICLEPADPSDACWVASKVVATLGPSSREVDTLVALLRAGVSCCRVDLTWGSLAYHRRSLQNLNEAMKRAHKLCAVMVDTVGREIMVKRPWSEDATGWPVHQDNFCVKAGNRVRLVSPDLDTSSNADGGTQGPPSPKPPSAADGQHAPPTAAVADQPVSPAGSPQQPGTVRLQSQKSDGGAYQQLVITYDGLHRLVQVGDNLYLGRYLAAGAPDAGSLFLKVEKMGVGWVECVAENSAELGGLLTVFHAERSDTGLENAQIDLPVLSAYDRACITRLASEFEIDFLGLSYVRSGEDVHEARSFLDEIGLHDTQVIAKVGTRAALFNYQPILEACSGVVVSRGLLGLDVPPEKMALVQKALVTSANLVGKPVIVTRVLDSMSGVPRPTRAEATDVANAILDGADGVLLGAETLRGNYPVETVRMAVSICRQAESVFDHKHHYDFLLESAMATVENGGAHVISPTLALPYTTTPPSIASPPPGLPPPAAAAGMRSSPSAILEQLNAELIAALPPNPMVGSLFRRDGSGAVIGPEEPAVVAAATNYFQALAAAAQALAAAAAAAAGGGGAGAAGGAPHMNGAPGYGHPHHPPPPGSYIHHQVSGSAPPPMLGHDTPTHSGHLRHALSSRAGSLHGLQLRSASTSLAHIRQQEQEEQEALGVSPPHHHHHHYHHHPHTRLHHPHAAGAHLGHTSSHGHGHTSVHGGGHPQSHFPHHPATRSGSGLTPSTGQSTPTPPPTGTLTPAHEATHAEGAGVSAKRAKSTPSTDSGSTSTTRHPAYISPTPSPLAPAAAAASAARAFGTAAQAFAAVHPGSTTSSTTPTRSSTDAGHGSTDAGTVPAPPLHAERLPAPSASSPFSSTPGSPTSPSSRRTSGHWMEPVPGAVSASPRGHGNAGGAGAGDKELPTPPSGLPALHRDPHMLAPAGPTEPATEGGTAAVVPGVVGYINQGRGPESGGATSVTGPATEGGQKSEKKRDLQSDASAVGVAATAPGNFSAPSSPTTAAAITNPPGITVTGPGGLHAAQVLAETAADSVTQGSLAPKPFAADRGGTQQHIDPATVNPPGIGVAGPGSLQAAAALAGTAADALSAGGLAAAPVPGSVSGATGAAGHGSATPHAMGDSSKEEEGGHRHQGKDHSGVGEEEGSADDEGEQEEEEEEEEIQQEAADVVPPVLPDTALLRRRRRVQAQMHQRSGQHNHHHKAAHASAAEGGALGASLTTTSTSNTTSTSGGITAAGMKASPTTGLAAPTHPTQGGAEQEHQESRGDPDMETSLRCMLEARQPEHGWKQLGPSVAGAGVSPDPSAWLTRAEAMDVAGQQQGGGPQSWSGTSPLGSTPTPGAYQVLGPSMMPPSGQYGGTALPYMSKLESITSSAVRAAEKVKAGLILVITHTARAAQLIAKYRPPMPILTLIVPRLVSDGLHWHLEGRSHARQCLLTAGLLPMLSAPGPSGDEVLEEAVTTAARWGLVGPHQQVVVVERVAEHFCIKIVAVDELGLGIKKSPGAMQIPSPGYPGSGTLARSMTLNMPRGGGDYGYAGWPPMAPTARSMVPSTPMVGRTLSMMPGAPGVATAVYDPAAVNPFAGGLPPGIFQASTPRAGGGGGMWGASGAGLPYVRGSGVASPVSPAGSAGTGSNHGAAFFTRGDSSGSNTGGGGGTPPPPNMNLLAVPNNTSGRQQQQQRMGPANAWDAGAGGNTSGFRLQPPSSQRASLDGYQRGPPARRSSGEQGFPGGTPPPPSSLDPNHRMQPLVHTMSESVAQYLNPPPPGPLDQDTLLGAANDINIQDLYPPGVGPLSMPSSGAGAGITPHSPRRGAGVGGPGGGGAPLGGGGGGGGLSFRQHPVSAGQPTTPSPSRLGGAGPGPGPAAALHLPGTAASHPAAGAGGGPAPGGRSLAEAAAAAGLVPVGLPATAGTGLGGGVPLPTGLPPRSPRAPAASPGAAVAGGGGVGGVAPGFGHGYPAGPGSGLRRVAAFPPGSMREEPGHYSVVSSFIRPSIDEPAPPVMLAPIVTMPATPTMEGIPSSISAIPPAIPEDRPLTSFDEPAPGQLGVTTSMRRSLDARQHGPPAVRHAAHGFTPEGGHTSSLGSADSGSSSASSGRAGEAGGVTSVTPVSLPPVLHLSSGRAAVLLGNGLGRSASMEDVDGTALPDPASLFQGSAAAEELSSGAVAGAGTAFADGPLQSRVLQTLGPASVRQGGAAQLVDSGSADSGPGDRAAPAVVPASPRGSAGGGQPGLETYTSAATDQEFVSAPEAIPEEGAGMSQQGVGTFEEALRQQEGGGGTEGRGGPPGGAPGYPAAEDEEGEGELTRPGEGAVLGSQASAPFGSYMDLQSHLPMSPTAMGGTIPQPAVLLPIPSSAGGVPGGLPAVPAVLGVPPAAAAAAVSAVARPNRVLASAAPGGVLAPPETLEATAVAQQLGQAAAAKGVGGGPDAAGSLDTPLPFVVPSAAETTAPGATTVATLAAAAAAFEAVQHVVEVAVDETRAEVAGAGTHPLGTTPAVHEGPSALRMVPDPLALFEPEGAQQELGAQDEMAYTTHASWAPQLHSTHSPGAPAGYGAAEGMGLADTGMLASVREGEEEGVSEEKSEEAGMDAEAGTDSYETAAALRQFIVEQRQMGMKDLGYEQEEEAEGEDSSSQYEDAHGGDTSAASIAGSSTLGRDVESDVTLFGSAVTPSSTAIQMGQERAGQEQEEQATAEASMPETGSETGALQQAVSPVRSPAAKSHGAYFSSPDGSSTATGFVVLSSEGFSSPGSHVHSMYSSPHSGAGIATAHARGGTSGEPGSAGLGPQQQDSPPGGRIMQGESSDCDASAVPLQQKAAELVQEEGEGDAADTAGAAAEAAGGSSQSSAEGASVSGYESDSESGEEGAAAGGAGPTDEGATGQLPRASPLATGPATGISGSAATAAHTAEGQSAEAEGGSSKVKVRVTGADQGDVPGPKAALYNSDDLGTSSVPGTAVQQLGPGRLVVDSASSGLSEGGRGPVEVSVDPRPPRSMPGQSGTTAEEGGGKVGQASEEGAGGSRGGNAEGGNAEGTAGQRSQENSPAARSEDSWVLTSP